MDAPDHLREEVVAVPVPVEAKGLTHRDQPIEAPPIERPGEGAELLGGKAEMGEGLIAPLDEGNEGRELRSSELEEEAAARVLPPQPRELGNGEEEELVPV